MCKVNFKFFWTYLLLAVSLSVSAQEICNNGIDDDGDTLIDLNDDDCGCAEVAPLTSITGSLCTNNFLMTLAHPDATSYQWYKDGVALVGQVSNSLTLSDVIPGVEGIYEVVATTPTGCVISEGQDVIVPEFYNYLGEESICDGDTIFFGPFILTTAGTFQFTTPAFQDGAVGCDSIVEIDVIVQQDDIFLVSEIACEGTEYVFGSQVLTQSGSYQEDFMSSAGCDSVVRLDLVFAPLDPILMFPEICRGETFTFRDIVETEPGIYETSNTSAGGCDTLFRVDLTVIDPVSSDRAEEICAGGEIIIDGTTYDASGTFELAYTAVSGCDSIVNLTITELPVEMYEIDRSICQGITFEYGDISATESGVYTTTIQTPGVCDSMITVNLDVVDPTPEIETMSICRGEILEWRGDNYDTPGAYETTEEVVGGCTVVYVLELEVTDPVAVVEQETLCQGLSIDWNGTVYTEAGTYEFLQTTPGQCDELFVLELEVTAPEVVAEVMAFCPDQLPFEFEDLKIDSSGIYSTIVSTPNDCDVEYQFDITVLETTESTADDVNLCEGDVYEFFGTEITSSGQYEAIIPNAAGCDSMITVQVLGLSVMTTQEDAEICPGESLDWNGMVITEEGEHTAILSNQFGCDSIVTLDLRFNTLITLDMDFAICAGETFEDYGISETETGDYQVMLSSGVGCDSLINIALTVNDTTMYAMDGEICAGETFELHGISATESGIYETKVPGGNATGCDSTVVVNLRVVSHEDTDESVEICEGEVYEFAGVAYTTSGTYPVTMTSSFGCDSMVNLILDVLPLGRDTEEILICPGDEVDFNGTLITEAGTYETRMQNAVGCDSLLTLVVTVDDPNGLISLPEDQVINIGSEIDVIPDFISPSLTDFEWSDENGNLLSQESELFAFAPIEDTWVELFATNEHGCEVRERLNIDVELIIDIYVPNVITPTKDDANRYFTLGANESVIGIKELYIYDRWGELMFTDAHDGNLDTYLGWDGTFKNQTVMQGVYAYVVVFDIIDGTEVLRKGSLTVLE